MSRRPVFAISPGRWCSATGSVVGVRMAPNYTDDNGTAISSRYRTGFLDFGYPGQEKRIRSLNLTGTGTVNVKVATNDAITLGTGTAVTLGTSPAVAEGYYNGPGKARNFSIEVSSTTAQWSLSSLTANIAAVRQSGLRAA
jgi:hypothetical protein